jgi:hypothetical protein
MNRVAMLAIVRMSTLNPEASLLPSRLRRRIRDGSRVGYRTGRTKSRLENRFGPTGKD